MTKAKMWLFLCGCISCFYITALIKDSGASEVSCLKTIWYLTMLNTVLQFVNLLNRVGALITLGNHEVDAGTVFFWHENKVLCRLFLLIQLIKAISMAILFYKVVSISNTCKNYTHGYVMFWYAAELQAFLFAIIFSILTVLYFFFACFLVAARVLGESFNQMFDVENPEPIPINHGIEMYADGDTPKPKKPEVKKTEVEWKACSICFENEKTHACIPCGHMCLCAFCAEDLSKKGVQGQNITRCPICRLEVDNISRIFQ
jgi:hypothetical protein